METEYDIVVNNKRGVQFKFTIHRKITIIRGDSATGKTTLFQMISDASSSRVSGVTISCDIPVRPLNESGYLLELQTEENRIYVVDEDFGPLKSKEFAKAVLQSNNCFIIITRESLPAIPYSYKEIYGMKTSGKFHSLERVYPDYEKFHDAESIVTEDEDAGYEYYRYFFGEKVRSSQGNSNLSKYGAEHRLLIGDGCAIGAYIQDILLTKADLYLPESFEWMLLQGDMFHNIKEVQELIEFPSTQVTTEYASMERYCTELLSTITRNTPAQYTKAHLNDCYVKDCCCKGNKCEFFTRMKKTELI
jgi:hypothetical protein